MKNSAVTTGASTDNFVNWHFGQRKEIQSEVVSLVVSCQSCINLWTGKRHEREERHPRGTKRHFYWFFLLSFHPFPTRSWQWVACCFLRSRGRVRSRTGNTVASTQRWLYYNRAKCNGEETELKRGSRRKRDWTCESETHPQKRLPGSLPLSLLLLWNS